VREQLRVVTIEQRALGAAPAIGIPMHRHHVGEIVGGDVDAPGIPIEQPQILAAVGTRQKDVPDMGVALHDREIAMGMVAAVQARSRLDQLLIKIAPLARQALAHAIGEADKLLCESFEL
jgi:hypothetical protein